MIRKILGSTVVGVIGFCFLIGIAIAAGFGLLLNWSIDDDS